VSEQYRVLAGRIHRELEELGRVVTRAERALEAARQRPEDQDLYLDSAALNLHDFYSGLERVFSLIAGSVDGSVPGGHEWHRELLRQMGTDIPQIRPAVLSAQTMQDLEEYLGFRHVVRHIYAFEFDFERVERLVRHLRPLFERVSTELKAFANLLERLS
jgi:hypothetical protein